MVENNKLTFWERNSLSVRFGRFTTSDWDWSIDH